MIIGTGMRGAAGAAAGRIGTKFPRMGRRDALVEWLEILNKGNDVPMEGEMHARWKRSSKADEVAAEVAMLAEASLCIGPGCLCTQIKGAAGVRAVAGIGEPSALST